MQNVIIEQVYAMVCLGVRSLSKIVINKIPLSRAVTPGDVRTPGGILQFPIFIIHFDGLKAMGPESETRG